MGFYASYNGSVNLKDVISKETIREIEKFIEEDVGGFCNSFDDSGNGESGYYYIEIHGDGNYHEDRWYEFFARIEPYIVGGEIEFRGEDDSQWRYNYSKNVYDARGHWYEESVVDVIWGDPCNLDLYIDDALEVLNEQNETD